MEKKTNATRRSFFAGVGLTAAAGLVAKLAPKTDAPVASGIPEESPGDKYRLTEHIKKYYRTTSI
ncbi:hypothetical protein Q8A64_12265 [Oxalobacteraceae bacterium R-40]|uniref:Formate dehydrogenase n=1 Tax=Keguizhuia sedimenti TaxID=3064264 RepID=A0ABU1BQM6_9BURK|nr:hypothetical protein [Oxalobacteraceae bacterium R-40]